MFYRHRSDIVQFLCYALILLVAKAANSGMTCFEMLKLLDKEINAVYPDSIHTGTQFSICNKDKQYQAYFSRGKALVVGYRFREAYADLERALTIGGSFDQEILFYMQEAASSMKDAKKENWVNQELEQRLSRSILLDTIDVNSGNANSETDWLNQSVRVTSSLSYDEGKAYHTGIYSYLGFQYSLRETFSDHRLVERISSSSELKLDSLSLGFGHSEMTLGYGYKSLDLELGLVFDYSRAIDPTENRFIGNLSINSGLLVSSSFFFELAKILEVYITISASGLGGSRPSVTQGTYFTGNLGEWTLASSLEFYRFYLEPQTSLCVNDSLCSVPINSIFGITPGLNLNWKKGNHQLDQSISWENSWEILGKLDEGKQALNDASRGNEVSTGLGYTYSLRSWVSLIAQGNLGSAWKSEENSQAFGSDSFFTRLKGGLRLHF